MHPAGLKAHSRVCLCRIDSNHVHKGCHATRDAITRSRVLLWSRTAHTVVLNDGSSRTMPCPCQLHQYVAGLNASTPPNCSGSAPGVQRRRGRCGRTGQLPGGNTAAARVRKETSDG